MKTNIKDGGSIYGMLLLFCHCAHLGANFMPLTIAIAVCGRFINFSFE